MAATIPRLPARWRTVVRAVHVLASVGWLGLVIVMLVLSLAAVTAGDGKIPDFLYQLMEQIGSPVIPIFALTTLVTGLALSIATPWGLIRRWWIVVKSVDKPWGKIKRGSAGRRRDVTQPGTTMAVQRPAEYSREWRSVL